MPRLPRQIPYPPSGILPGQWTPNGLCIRDGKGRSTIDRARHIQRSLGTYRAARYLKARGWSVEAALHILTHARKS